MNAQYSEEAERGVLGAYMIDEIRVRELCLAQHMTVDFFYIPAHRHLYEIFVAMERDNIPLDLLSVCEYLKRHNRLNAVGGYKFLEGLIDSTPIAAHAEYYLNFVVRDTQMRQATDVYQIAIDKLHTTEIDNCTDIIARTTAQTDDILRGAFHERSITEVNQSIVTSWTAPCIQSMYLDLNLAVRYEGMIVLAGYPSCGKTAFALTETKSWAKGGFGVAGMSLEMSEEKLRERMACSECGVSSMALWRGDATEDQKQQVIAKLDELGKLPIYLNDQNCTCDAFCAWAKSMVTLHKVSVIWLDYLQLFKWDDLDARLSAEQRIARWSNRIKELQKTLGIPIFVLSQLSRPITASPMKTPPAPSLQSLRYSGAIEQDADVAIFIYQKPMVDIDEFKATTTWEEFIDIQKQRNGSLTKIECKFKRSTQEFILESEFDNFDELDATSSDELPDEDNEEMIW